MKDRSDIENRYEQFCYVKLPGQPRIAHMGTSYLMADLHEALVETEAERDRLREALEVIKEHLNARFNVAAIPRDEPTIGDIARRALQEAEA